MVAIVGQAEQHKAMARAFMRTKPDGSVSVIAQLIYKGQHFESEVPVDPREGNLPAIAAALEDVKKKAKAVQLTDLHTMERIR